MGSKVYEALKKRAAETNGAEAKRNGAGAEAQAEVEKGVELASNVAAPPNGRHEGAREEHEGSPLSPSNGSRAASGPAAGSPSASPEFLFQSSRHFNAPESAHVSASNEHTGTPAGSALSGGQASRAAGATLGAAGSARTPEFVSLDISAARVEPHLVAVTQPRSGHAERFRSLRTRLLHAGERKNKTMQAFVITSAGIMEGKTLTAVNLSWLLAQTDGVSALLIDGDLRNPCCADYFGIDAPTGLSEVLGGEVSLADAIIRLEPAGLHLLPGGSVRDDVAELLSGPKFSAVLAEARRMFDYIIIDAPPLAVFTDAAVLINRADSSLIVARAGHTRYSALERLLAPVPRERILGVILNGSEEQLTEQNYYYRRYKTRRAEGGGEAE